PVPCANPGQGSLSFATRNLGNSISALKLPSQAMRTWSELPRSQAPIVEKQRRSGFAPQFWPWAYPKAISSVAKRLRRDRRRFKLRSNDYLNVQNFAPVPAAL